MTSSDYMPALSSQHSLREICERVAVKARNSFILISPESVDRFYRLLITRKAFVPSTVFQRLPDGKIVSIPGEGTATSTRFASGVIR